MASAPENTSKPVTGSTRTPKRPLTPGRRAYRGLIFAAIVGVVSAGLSVMPALFVQSIFIGNSQRCEEQQTLDLAAYGEIRTSCAEILSTTPRWLPATIIAGGGLLGVLGGAAYGYISPKPVARRREDRDEQSWLPF
jgi:hypothetical protein